MDEVLVRGKTCSRVDLGNSMRVTIIDVTAVQDVQVAHRQLNPTGCREGKFKRHACSILLQPSL